MKSKDSNRSFIFLIGFAGALGAAAVLRAVTPSDAGGLLGCTLTGEGVGQLRGVTVECLCSLVFVFVVCAGLIGYTADDCRASVASTEGSEFASNRQVAAPFVAGATITGLSVFAVSKVSYILCLLYTSPSPRDS